MNVKLILLILSFLYPLNVCGQSKKSNPHLSQDRIICDFPDVSPRDSLFVLYDKECKSDTEKIFTKPDKMPAFPGGVKKMQQFIVANLEFPHIGKSILDVNGTVIVQFVVGKDGKIRRVRATKSIGAGCDEKAIKVIRKMPKWIPGKKNGVPVSVQLSLPITFRLI